MVDPDELVFKVFFSMIPTQMIKPSHVKFPVFLVEPNTSFNSGHLFSQHILPFLKHHVKKLSTVDKYFLPYLILPIGGPIPLIYVIKKKILIRKEDS